MAESQNVRIMTRPIGTPLPLGFLGQVVASFSFSAVELGWIPKDQGHVVALAALGFAVPLHAVSALFGFLARDPVAGTGMGILAGTWATVGVTTLTSPPGTTSPGLGVALLASGAAMLVPATAGRRKIAAAAVMAVTAARFAATGIAELTGAAGWMTTAGWVGLTLSTVSFYAALSFELEGSEGRDVLPVGRRGGAATALRGTEAEQLAGVANEPGVRNQL